MAPTPGPLSLDLLTDGNKGSRAISDAAAHGLGQSLTDFGDLSGIVANRIGNALELIAGHQRLAQLRAAGAKGWTLIAPAEGDAEGAGYVEHPATGARFPVRLVTWPLAKAVVARYTANNAAIAGTFTPAALAELAALADTDFPRFDDLGLETLLGQLREAMPEGGGTPGANPDDVPEPLPAPVSRPGDLWLLGKHRLLCGDSTKGEDVARVMAGERAVLMATDPPYGVSYADKNRFLNAVAPANRIQEPIAGDHGTANETSALWKAAFTAARAVLVPGASYYVTGPQGGDLLLLLLALRESGFPLRHMLIWAKNNHVLGRCDYHYQHEPIAFGWIDGTHKFYGGHGETSLWAIDRPHESKLHPTMKPVALFVKAHQNSSAPGAIVYEPFSGSGTQIVAAQQTGRRCFAVEIDAQYVDVAVMRWQKFTGKEAVLDGDGRTFAEVAAERAVPQERS